MSWLSGLTSSTRSGNSNFTAEAREQRRLQLEEEKKKAVQRRKDRQALIAGIQNPPIETVETLPDVFGIALDIFNEDIPKVVKMGIHHDIFDLF